MLAALPEPTGEFMADSVMNAMSFLAKSKVHPCMYSDLFDIMGAVRDVMERYSLTEEKFMAIYHSFEPVKEVRRR